MYIILLATYFYHRPECIIQQKKTPENNYKAIVGAFKGDCTHSPMMSPIRNLDLTFSMDLHKL